MGGDHGPATTVPAVAAFLRRHSDTRILLFGVARELPSFDRYGGRLTVVDCPQRLDADERPAQALRHKRESSLWRALAAVAAGRRPLASAAGKPAP